MRAGERVLELGAGCGVVAMLVAALSRPREIVAVELQPELARLIGKNAELNRQPVTAVCADIRERKIPGLAPGSFDLVIANPPYRKLRGGRASPDPGRRAARSESSGELIDFAAAAGRYARAGARVALVFTASRSIDLIAALRAHALEPKRIRFVHPRHDKPASTILVEARKGGGVETTVEPPLVMYDRPGVYSAAALKMLSGL